MAFDILLQAQAMTFSKLRQLIVTLLLIGLAACDSEQASISAITASAPAAAASGTNSPRVSLVMKTLTNPFFIEMEKGARRAAQETGTRLDIKTATQETSIEQQIKIVEDTVKRGTDAIVIAPGDSVRLVPALKQAQQAGIHIVNIDNRLDARAMAAQGMRPVPFISINNETAAFTSAMELSRHLPALSAVAIIEGIPSADNAKQRRLGAQRAFQQAGMQLVASKSAYWKIDDAYTVTQSLLKQHPNLRGIFCANDMMAIGARKYLTDSKRTHILVAGFDAIPDARLALARGELVATMDQQGNEQGYQGVKTALAMLAGKPVPAELLVDSVLLRSTRPGTAP